jgi:hypothetical protein
MIVDLIQAFFLFSSITVLQFFAAIIANSNALKVRFVVHGCSRVSNNAGDLLKKDTTVHFSAVFESWVLLFGMEQGWKKKEDARWG